MTWLGPFCAFMSSVTWAFGSTGYSRLSSRYGGFAVNFGRASVALPLFLLAAFVAGGGWAGGLADLGRVTPWHVSWLTLGQVCSYGFADTVFLISTQSIGVPTALAIASTYPVLTAGAGVLLHHEAVSWLQFAGLLITVSGVVLVVLNAPESRGKREAPTGALTGSTRRGLLLATATAFLWGMNSFVINHAGHGLSAAVGNVVRMVVALGLIAVLSRFFGPRRPFVLPVDEYRRSWPLFAFEAFGGSYCFMYGLSNSPLALGSTLSSLAPVISVPIAWAMRLEKFSIYRTLGVCLTVLGLTVLVGGG